MNKRFARFQNIKSIDFIRQLSYSENFALRESRSTVLLSTHREKNTQTLSDTCPPQPLYAVIQDLSSSDPTAITAALININDRLIQRRNEVAEQLSTYDILTPFTRLLSNDNTDILEHATCCISNYSFSLSFCIIALSFFILHTSFSFSAKYRQRFSIFRNSLTFNTVARSPQHGSCIKCVRVLFYTI